MESVLTWYAFLFIKNKKHANCAENKVISYHNSTLQVKETNTHKNKSRSDSTIFQLCTEIIFFKGSFSLTMIIGKNKKPRTAKTKQTRENQVNI
jgi:hypothetical protein